MKVALSPEIVNTLPVHDAHVEGIAIRTSANGETNLNLRLQIHPDESLDPFIKLGVTTPIVNLRFENCWRIVSNLLGCESKAEVLFGWEVLADSDLIQDMYNRFPTIKIQLFHHRFEFSGGSVLDILTERVFLQEVSQSEPELPWT